VLTGGGSGSGSGSGSERGFPVDDMPSRGRIAQGKIVYIYLGWREGSQGNGKILKLIAVV